MRTNAFFAFLFFINISFAQEIETKFIESFPLKADTFIGMDEIENLYYIQNNTFYKRSVQETVSYTNPSLGAITSVNIQNPFKIVLFYKAFNSIIILDNQLNELTTKIDLTRESEFNNVLFVSPSSQNDLWLFADDNKLHLYNYKDLSEKIQTQPITFYQNDFVIRSLQSSYKNVWILSDSNVILFNEYGNFIENIDLINLEFIFPFQKGFIFYREKGFYYYDNKTSYPISIGNDKLIKDVSINNISINIYDGSSVYKYDFVK